MVKSIHSQITMQTRAGFYQGGKKTVANRDFWNGTSDFETIASPDRDTLRARARWLHENNSIMSNIDNSIINNVLGSGIRMQYETDNEKLNKQVTALFSAWATNRKKCDHTKRQTFHDMQQQILQSRMVDGEIFIHKIPTPDGLKIRLVEADSLDGGIDSGIEKDSLGAVTAYRFTINGQKKITVKEADMINYFRMERPSQYRGITEYKQAVLDIKNFSAFQTATIEGVRARANIGYIVETDDPQSSFTNKVDDEEVQEVGGVAVHYLRKGEKMSQMGHTNAGSDYTPFSSTTIRGIATARKVSYELAFKDYSQVNFASSRASLLQDWKLFDREQTHFIEYVLEDIFEAWLDVEVALGRVKIPALKYAVEKESYLKPRWVLPKRDWVDPLKDISAIEKEIALGLTTATDVALSRGEDYADNMKKLASEIELQKKLKVYDEMHPELMKQEPIEGEKKEGDNNATKDD